MTSPSKRYWLIGLVILAGISISSVYAVGLPDCDDYNLSSGAGAVCHRVDIIISQVNTMISNQEVIKAQNSQMILQQTVTNHILADEYCKTAPSEQMYNDCLTRELGGTR